MNDLATAIARGFASLDPAVLLQTIEQAGQGWFFNSHSLRDFFLGELFVTGLRKMDQGSPFALAEAEGAEPAIEIGAPGSGGPEEEKSELVGVGGGHTKLVSVLTKFMPIRLSNCRSKPVQSNLFRHMLTHFLPTFYMPHH